MNPVKIISNWMTDISTNKIGHLNTTTDIQNTIQMVLELPISDCNKMFFENLLTFTRQDPLNIDTKTSLVTGLSLFLDYFFINSFKNQTNDFEEFLKMDCVERDLLDNDRRVIFESPKSPDNIKLQVQKSVLQAGQKYSLGETDMKVIEIKDNGVLYLLWEHKNRKLLYGVNNVDHPILTIGRKTKSHFRFKDDYKLSSTHAIITRENKRWYITDNYSKNGVWIYKSEHMVVSTDIDTIDSIDKQFSTNEMVSRIMIEMR